MIGELSGWAATGTVFPSVVVLGLALHAFRAATSGAGVAADGRY